MDKHNFIRNIPLYTYTALRRWFYFSICLFIFFTMGFCIIDIPLMWQWYQKKTLYNKRKHIYAQEQEMRVQQKNLQKEIEKLRQHTDKIHHEQQSEISLLKKIIDNPYGLIITSLKKTDKVIVLEGTDTDINTITNRLKQLAEETHFTFTLQSVERKNMLYFFHAHCQIKK